MNLNNKGFAITGILYTLFILFLLILLAVLSSLSLLKNLTSESVDALENSLSGTQVELSKVGTSSDASWTAPFSGKYVFKINEEYVTSELADVTCSTYLKKGTTFDKTKITFIPLECDTYIKNNLPEITLIEAYSFEEWS